VPATGQEHQAKAGPHKPSPARAGTRFSIPDSPVRARSPRPRSDNHRSRNHFTARKPGRTLRTDKRISEKSPMPHTPNPHRLRRAPRTAAAC